MGYAYYVIDGRECGYGVEAVCDWEECDNAIDRGLSYACGGYPGEGEDFCSRYVCAEHLIYTEAPTPSQRCPECADLTLSEGVWK